MRYFCASLFLVLLFCIGCPREPEPVFARRRITMPEFTEEELARAEPLEVTAAGPVGPVAQFTEADELLVTFSEPMTELAAVEDSLDFPLLLEPDLPGSCHWLGVRTVVFRPAVPLPPATEFLVRIPRGVRAVSGAMLKEDYEFRFSTPRPELEYSSPWHGSRMVGLEEPVFLRFNQPVDPRRAARYIRLLENGQGGRRVRVRRPGPGLRPDEWWYEDADSARILVVQPVGRLKIETGYRLVLAEGLPGRDGNLGLAREEAVEFRTFNRFRFEGLSSGDGHHPEDELSFTFSNPVRLSEVADKVSFQPEAGFPARYLRLDWDSRHPSFALALKPETRYRVRLSRWLRDIYGNRLGRDMTVDLRVLSYRPSFGMLTGQGIVESEGELFHPVRMVNIDSLAVRMRRLEASEVVGFWRAAYERYDEEGRPWQRAGFFRHERRWRPGLERNQRAILPLRLEPGLTGARSRSGFLFVELDGFGQTDRHSRYSRAFLQVSPYGLTGKFAPESGLALVTRLSDAGPVPDAELELRDDDNRVLWRGRSGPDGLATLPGWQALGVKSRDRWSGPRLWLFCRTGEGEAFVHSDWGTGIGPWEFGVSYDWNPDPTRPEAFIFTEKGLYRQADTVRIKGLVRSRKLGRWVLPGVRRGLVRVSDSRGEEVARQDISLNEFGGFDLAVALRPDAVSGWYSIVCELGEDDFHGSFRVEAYRPAEFEVLVESDRDEYIAGDELSGRILARYLFGAAMSGDRAEWSVSLSPTRHTPPGYDGYEWGPGSDDDDWQDGYRQLASGAGRLDDAGRLAVRAKLDPGRGLSCYRVNLEATVTARNERSISGRGSWLLHRAEYYAGIRPGSRFLTVGDSVAFDLVTARPDGEPVTGQNLSITVYRRVWLSARKAQTGGRYGWVSEPKDEKVASFRVRTGDAPQRRSFRPDRPGYYRVRVTGRDQRRNPVRTETDFWVAGAGEASWLMKDDDLLELVRDRPGYRPGDTARILVKSPWNGVRALVTVEREHVIDRFITEVKGNADYIPVPIREEYLPNVFVSVILLKGRSPDAGHSPEGDDLGKPGFRVGYVELPVEPASRRLEVKLSAAREQYEPGDTVEIEILVRRADGSPVRAEATVAVVDLGVLRLIGFETPDPFRVFYASRPLAVATVESRLHVMGQRNYGQKGLAAGDGEHTARAEAEPFGGRFRDRFLETALWLPAVRTGPDGRARVRVVLPDNLTTWQAMAVAATVEEFGSGETRFRAEKPLLLAPSLPRFVRPGDEFRAGVVVHNRTERELEVEVRARGAGAAVLGGDAVRRVRVRPAEPVELLFDWRCAGDRTAELRFEATAGNLRDALRLELPVRNPPLLEATALFESSEDSVVRQGLNLPTDVLAGVGGLEISAASSGLAGLERGLEYLRSYPYDCLEQRLSRALPFIVGEELINEFGLSELQGAALRRFVQAELDEVARYQDQAGGFRFWAGESYFGRASPYLTAYTLYVLGRAREAGYPVDIKVAHLGRAWLLNWLDYERPDAGWPYSTDERLTTRALALYALTFWEADVSGRLNLLVENADRLGIFGRACLLNALARVGAQPAADRVAGSLLNALKLAPTTAHFTEPVEGGRVWHSHVRSTAVVLEALIAARGGFEHADKVARWLTQERRVGRWRTTQENAYVFAALTAYYRAYERVAPDFLLEVRVAGKEALQAAFRGRSLESRRRFLPLDQLEPGRSEIELRRQGAGRFYYGLRLSYAPTGELQPRSEGFRVEKTIRPAEGRHRGYRRGETYLVTLTVRTDQERLFVILDDPLPAGFEIVNTSFATESRELAARLDEARRADESPWWGGFDYEEIYDDRYLLYATTLARGTHTRTYLVKALTPGRFLAPPAKVEEMYAPEVFGYTGQTVIEVE